MVQERLKGEVLNNFVMSHSKLTHPLSSKMMGLEENKLFGFTSFYCLLFPFHKRKSMFAELHSDINSLKSSLLHLTGQPYWKKSGSAKVKDGIINLFLRNNLIDRYT